MTNEERLEAYAERRAVRGQAVTIRQDLEPHQQPWLTSAERRRLKGRPDGTTHSHEDLLVVVDGDGKARRQPCPKCNPRPRLKRRVGGIT